MAEHRGAERLVEFTDALVDDSAHITKYRAIGLAEGLQQGSEADALWSETIICSLINKRRKSSR